ncbi:MAG: PepSY domain-containing protein [Candidatus Nitrospinota bacterium M3_3B_026]
MTSKTSRGPAFLAAAASILLFIGGPLMPPCHADEDHYRAKSLYERGDILPLEKIIEKAAGKRPGRVLEAELEMEDGIYIYEIELLDENGVVWELRYDARTGEPVDEKRDD